MKLTTTSIWIKQKLKEFFVYWTNQITYNCFLKDEGAVRKVLSLWIVSYSVKLPMKILVEKNNTEHIFFRQMKFFPVVLFSRNR